EADGLAHVRIAVGLELVVHPQRVGPPVEIAIGRLGAGPGLNFGVLLQDVADDLGPHINRRVELVVDDALGDRIHRLVENVDHHDALDSGRGDATGFDGPPVLAQVEYLLVGIPGNDIEGPG